MAENDWQKQPLGVIGIMKRDVLGRMSTTASQREALLEEYERSELSGPQFARMAGINYQTLATWRQARNRKRLQNKANTQQDGPEVKCLKKEAPPFHFAQVMVPASALELRSKGSTLLRVQLSEGIHLDIRDAGQVSLAVQLIKGLGGLTPAC